MRTADPKNNKNEKDALRTEISTIDNLFINRTPQFLKPDYAEISLPHFAMLGTLHLALLKDTIINGSEWGYTPTELKTKKRQIRDQIKKYTQDSVKVFKSQLQSPLTPLYTSSYNKQTEYITGMTINFLDIIRLWPTFDPIDYPMEIDLELTRVLRKSIYGDQDITPPQQPFPVDTWKADSTTDINNTGIGIPIYGNKNLSGISIHQYSDNSNWFSGPDGITHQYTDGSIVSYGNTDQNQPLIPIATDNPLVGINFRYPWPKTAIDLFYFKDNGYYGRNLTNHKIHAVYPAFLPGDPIPTHAVGASYIPLELFPQNILGMPDNNNKITAIGFPFEKSSKNSSVRLEWINGANPVFMNRSDSELVMDITNVTSAKYKIRFRVATNSDNQSLTITIPNLLSPTNKLLPNTSNMINPNEFETDPDTVHAVGPKGENENQYVLVDGPEIKIPSGSIQIITTVTGPTYLDRIEFVPLPSDNPSPDPGYCNCEKKHNECFVCFFVEPESLKQITNQVNQLFTSPSYTELAHTVSDYKIDQVVLKVDALSDDVFGVEKKALRKLVNQAKQLSKARNVLVGGNFEKGHEWALGRKATMVANHDLFKGDHLLLPPPTMHPSYAYQKIDESKLKSNTRYTVSGFVAQSEQLEVVVSRYGKEVHDMLDVPYEEALPISSDESPNCCKPVACQCSSCDGSQPDSHFFSYSIDVGSLQSDVNLGIEFGLRIAKPNGFAKISNLEIKEDRPLTEKEIKKVQRKEQKWKKAFDQEQTEVTTTLQPTLNQINALYQNEDWNGSLHPHVTYQHLSAVILPTLPKQTHWFMEDRQGEHVVLTQQFQQALDRAFQQIEEQNLIHNGSFANELTDWTVTGDAHVTIQDDDQVLELSHWDASVSQTIEIMDFEEETEYKLRVRGKGKGTVTIQHGEEELETMTFNTTSFTTQEQTFYFEGDTVDVHVQSENNTFLVDSVELIEVVEE
ncbi:insecticidal delta-endotoxin Cry8Ea1 family protein [Bacillus cereus]